MIFKGIKEAHYKFNFPGSFRTGTVIKDNLVVRSYSNGIIKKDKFLENNIFQYELKNSKIKKAFKNNKKNKIPIFLFVKIDKNKVIFLGKSYVFKVLKDVVLLKYSYSED